MRPELEIIVRVDHLPDDPTSEPSDVVDVRSADPVASLVIRPIAVAVDGPEVGPWSDGRGRVGSFWTRRSRGTVAGGGGGAMRPGPFGGVDDGVETFGEMEKSVL